MIRGIFVNISVGSDYQKELTLLAVELRGIIDQYIILFVLANPAAKLRGMRELDSIPE